MAPENEGPDGSGPSLPEGEHHDVDRFADDLGAKLSARSRNVCVFLGAGASKACGLPDVRELQALVARGLGRREAARFEAQLKDRTLEEALSRIRRIEALLRDGSGRVDDLDAASARALDRRICQQIVAHLKSDGTDLEPMLRFASWVAQTSYEQPLELFTVNYDVLLETAMERWGIPYFDGFIGALGARFQIDLVEAAPNDSTVWLPSFLVRLWKLHGSVNWEWEHGRTSEVLRRGGPVTEAAAIYPSDAKYDESRRLPFVTLQDRFRRSLQVPETLVLCTGYSWGDPHLNEVIFDAARRRPRTEIVAFCFSGIPSELASKAVALPNVQVVANSEAILGGVRGPWRSSENPPVDVWHDGGCCLGDFRHLARFLSHSTPSQGNAERRLIDLLGSTAAANA